MNTERAASLKPRRSNSLLNLPIDGNGGKKKSPDSSDSALKVTAECTRRPALGINGVVPVARATKTDLINLSCANLGRT